MVIGGSVQSRDAIKRIFAIIVWGKKVFCFAIENACIGKQVLQSSNMEAKQ